MAEQKVKLTQLPEATDTIDTAVLLVNQNQTDQRLPVTHFLRAKNNLSELENAAQARANLGVPSVEDVNDKVEYLIDGKRTFLNGATLESERDFIWDDNSKSWYYWTGAFSKEVPAASTPESTGGIGAGKWLSVGDAVLRTQISDPDGATKYPALQIARWRDTGDIRGWGAIEGTDCSDALQAAIKDRASLGWGTSSDVIIDGSYRVDKKVLIPTDLRLIGNWASITSSLDDYIFESAYVDDSGELVSNWHLSDDDAIAKARLKGVQISSITFVDCSMVFKFKLFNERCELRDIYFERCGVAWEMVMPFYSSFKNIFIRSTKKGYEDWYACLFGRQTNLVDIYKVTVSEREYGVSFSDEEDIPNKLNVFYEMVSMRQCSWEHVNFPVTLNMDGYSLKIEDYYAEVVSGPLFRVLSGIHYDLKIGSSSWLAEVGNMGEFRGLRGDSTISQASQGNYKPPKPASLLFNDSNCHVKSALRYNYGNTINYDQNNTIRLEFPMEEKTNQVTNYQFITNSLGKVCENIAKSNIVSLVGGDLLLRTDIAYSKYNMMVISIGLNRYDCGAVFIGEQLIKQYGYTFVIGPDSNGNTSVNIVGTGINSTDDIIIEGCIRYL